MQRWKCPISNGTLKSFVWLYQEWIRYPSILFHLRILCKSDLRISCLWKVMDKLSEFKTFLEKKYLSHCHIDICMKGNLNYASSTGSDSTFVFMSRVNLSAPSLYCIARTLNRTSRCNKVDAVRFYALYRFNLLLPKEQRCVTVLLTSVS